MRRLFRAADLLDRERPARSGGIRAGLSKVYTFGPTFAPRFQYVQACKRFWMIEPEMAFAI